MPALRSKNQEPRTKNRLFRTLLLETLDKRMLMAADLQIELLENQFSPEYVETDAPVQEHRESLNSFKAEAKNIASTVNPDIHSDPKLSKLLSQYSEHATASQQFDFNTAAGLAWKDFEKNLHSQGNGPLTNPQMAATLGAFQSITSDSIDVQRNFTDYQAMQVDSTDGSVDPNALEQQIALVTANPWMLADQSIAEAVGAGNSFLSSDDQQSLLNFSDSALTTVQSTLADSNGELENELNKVDAFENSLGLTAEGETAIPSPFKIPANTVPTSILVTNQVSIDQFSPSTAPVNVLAYSGGFNANTTPANADLQTQGVSSFHSVTYTWIDAQHWSMTEVIIFSFNYSSSDTFSSQLPPVVTASQPNDLPTHTPHASASAVMNASRSVSIVLVFSASRGITSLPEAGVAWSMSVSTSDSTAFSFTASTSMGITPGSHNVPLDATVTSPSQLRNYTSNSTSSAGISFSLVLTSSISASGTPSLVSVSSSPTGTMIETDFTYDASQSANFNIGLSFSASRTSASGNLPSSVPMDGVFMDPASYTWGEGSGSVNGGGCLTCFDPGSPSTPPMPLPESGIGHSSASATASQSMGNTSSSSGISMRGKVRSDGRFSGITGNIRAQMADAWADQGSDNGMISLRIQDSDATGTFYASMVSGRNVNGSAAIGVLGNNGVAIGATEDGKLTALPDKSGSSINGAVSSGNANVEFLGVGGAGEVQTALSHSTWAAENQSSNATINSASIQVGASNASGPNAEATAPNELKNKQSMARFESEKYNSMTSLFAYDPDPLRKALDGSPAFIFTKYTANEAWTFNSGAGGEITATPDSSEPDGVGVSNTSSGQANESFSYNTTEQYVKQSRNEGRPGIPGHQQSTNNSRSARYSIAANTTLDGSGEPTTTNSGDSRVMVSGTYHSNSGPLGALVNSTLDLATGIVTIQSSIGFNTMGEDGESSSGTLNGTYQTPNWDGRNSYEHLLDGSPDPNPPATASMQPAGVVIPAPRTKSWSEWGLEMFAGSKGDAFDQGVNVLSGFGDNVTFGISAKMRELHGMDYVDKNTWAYFAGDMAGNFMPGPSAIAKPGTALWKAYNKFDDLGDCASTFTKLVHGGCFVAGTKVTVSELPYSASRESTLWSETDWISNNEYSFSPSPLYSGEKGPGDEGFGSEKFEFQSVNLKSQASSLKPARQIPIEQVPLGARVPTKNPKPWEYDYSLPDPVQTDWAKISITMHRKDGGVVDAELIRPRSWIAKHSIMAGKHLLMNMEELQVHGSALVTSIEDCPEIADGEGSVVTAKFLTREVNTIARVEILGVDGQIEVLEGTIIHPIWSVDRDDWVPLGNLVEGETLLGVDGLASVLSIAIQKTAVAVYNIEVRGEHAYQVSELGLVVHNECVYQAFDASGNVIYVGITKNFKARKAAHAGRFDIVEMKDGLTRADARAIEQHLIDKIGLGKNGGTLLNKINSIATNNPIFSTIVGIVKTHGF